LIKSKQDIHVLHSLSACSFEEVVYGAVNYKHVAFLLQVDQAFVGIDHLFEVYLLVSNSGEWMRLIIILE